MWYFTRLAHRSIIKIKGSDCDQLLQGIITNDINNLQNGSVIYALMLTHQGRFFCDLIISKGDDFYLIDCETAQRNELIKKLNLYKLRLQVEITSCENMNSYIIWSQEPQAWDQKFTITSNMTFVKDPRLSNFSYHLYADSQEAEHIFHQNNIKSAPLEFYDNYRIPLGIPDGSRDMIVGRSTALECGMDQLNAISWSKGCYLGQELTARSKYTGIVRKHLIPFSFPQGFNIPSPETPIIFDSNEIGDMRSHTQNYGLGFIRLEALKQWHDQGRSAGFSWGGHPIIPILPAWFDLKSFSSES